MANDTLRGRRMRGKLPKEKEQPVIGGNGVPVFDDGGIVDKAIKAGRTFADQFSGLTAPMTSEAQALGETNKNVNEYATGAKPKAVVEPVVSSSDADKMHAKARYGDRSGEKRIDTSQMTRSLTTTESGLPKVSRAEVFDTGGAVGSSRKAIGDLTPDPGEAQRAQALSVSNAEASQAADSDLPIMDAGGEMATDNGGKTFQAGDGNIIADSPKPRINDRRMKAIQDNEPNVNDGKHQAIIVEEGERVLTPQQNAEFMRNQHGYGIPKIKLVEGDHNEGPLPSWANTPRSGGLPKIQGVGKIKLPGEGMSPVYDEGGVVPVLDRSRKIADLKGIAAQHSNDIMGIGQSALEHQQLNKAEERIAGPISEPYQGGRARIFDSGGEISTDVQPSPSVNDLTLPTMLSNHNTIALPGKVAPKPVAGASRTDEGAGPSKEDVSALPVVSAKRQTAMPSMEVQPEMARSFNMQPTPGTKADVDDTKHMLNAKTDELIKEGAPLETIDASRAMTDEYKLQHPTMRGIPRILQNLIPTNLRGSIPGTALNMRDQILGAEHENAEASRTNLQKAQADEAGAKAYADLHPLKPPTSTDELIATYVAEDNAHGIDPEKDARIAAAQTAKQNEGTPKAAKVNFSQGGEPLSVTFQGKDYVPGDPKMPADAAPSMDQAMKNYQANLLNKEGSLKPEQAKDLNATYDKFLQAAGMPTGQFHAGMSKDERTQMAQAINSGLAAYRASVAAQSGQQKAQDAIADQKSRYASIQTAVNQMADVAPMFDKPGVGVALSNALTPQLEHIPVGGLVEGVPVGVSIPAGTLDNLVTRGVISAAQAQTLINRYNLAAEAAIQFLMVQQGGKIGRGGPALMQQVQNLIPGAKTTSSADARDKLNLFQNQFDIWKKNHGQYAEGLTSFRDKGYTPSNTELGGNAGGGGGFAAWKNNQQKGQ